MKNILLSVFNEQGNFANTIELNAELAATDVSRILAPHVVTQGTTVDTMSVRPMRGLTINEQDFYRLVLATLRNAEALADSGSLVTGYGNYVMNAEMVEGETGTMPGCSITITEESTGVVVLATSITVQAGNVVGDREYADFAINNLVTNQQALASLVNTGTEYLVAKFQEWADQSEVIAEVAEPAKPQRPERPRVQQDSPKLPATPAAPTLPSKSEVRGKVKEALEAAREHSQTPERFMVSIPMKIEGRDISDVAVEVDRTNFDRIGDEGVLTTILQSLNCTIVEDRLYLTEATGFLMKIRTAFKDHGIDLLSVTPRGAKFDSDSEHLPKPISILDL